jgi:hypothetical protein
VVLVLVDGSKPYNVPNVGEYNIMLKVETLAIALCVFTLAGFAMYALDMLNIPGADHLVQQANAMRRSTHQCEIPVYGC